MRRTGGFAPSRDQNTTARAASGVDVMTKVDTPSASAATAVVTSYSTQVPFVRLDHNQSGLGLGLAIAKQALDAPGGWIRVQNLPGKGCIFVLELPVPCTGLPPYTTPPPPPPRPPLVT